MNFDRQASICFTLLWLMMAWHNDCRTSAHAHAYPYSLIMYSSYLKEIWNKRKAKQRMLNYSISVVIIWCFPLFYIIVNWMFRGCGLFIGRNKTFEGVTLNFGKLELTFYPVAWCFIDSMINWDEGQQIKKQLLVDFKWSDGRGNLTCIQV